MIQPRKINQKKSKGDIYLHSMPGKNEDLKDFMNELKKLGVQRIFCLTDKKEIESKSPHYLEAVYYGHYDGIYITYCPSPDFGIPKKEKDLLTYDKAIHEAFNILNHEKGHILIHCQGGIGRTGTFATILMRKLGFSFEQAIKATNASGSNPGNEEQIDFCRNYTID